MISDGLVKILTCRPTLNVGFSGCRDGIRACEWGIIFQGAQGQWGNLIVFVIFK